MKKDKLNFASMFGNNPDISLDERARAINEIKKIGSLTFTVDKHADGWLAQCKEVSGIITGNSNPNATPLEIESLIREAIYAAFNVRFQKSADSSSPLFRFKYMLQGEPC